MTVFLYSKNDYYVNSDPIKIKNLPFQVIKLLSIIFGYGLLGFWIIEKHFSQFFNFLTASKDVLSAVLFFYEPLNQPITIQANKFIFTLYALGFGFYSYCFFNLMSSVFSQKINNFAKNFINPLTSKFLNSRK